MSGFREPELERDQMVLFAHRLDDAIPENHPVRCFEAILRSTAFLTAFDSMASRYVLSEGKPPFHPKYLSSLWLYGMMNRLRSSRVLESACHNRIDVRWLMEGQTPDHSTICGFVARHRRDLKKLLKATLEVAVGSELLKVQHLAVDGSKVEANAGKDSMRGRPALEKKLKEIEEAVEKSLKEWEENEARDAGSPEAPWTPPKKESPERDREAAVRQKAKLNAALEALERREREHEESGAREGPTPAASTTDADARLMKDKEGRSKPNYTTQVGVDPKTGLITAEDVTDAPWDGGGLLPMLQQTEENTGVKPQAVSADSAYNTGPALMHLEEKRIAAYMPDSGESRPSSPERSAALEAARSGAALTDAQKTLIIERRTQRLSREAFEYVASRDVYVCPRGASLQRVRTHPDVGVSGIALRTQYRSDRAVCASCPLSPICLTAGARSRMITRDQYESHREQLRQRMATDTGREEYAKRTVTERTHAWLKTIGGLRKFLRRGFAGVRAEFTVACTALNMRILIQRFGELRIAAGRP
jgi:transposase